MIRILTMTLMFAAIISTATSAEARRAYTANGASLNGVATLAPVVIVAVELPSKMSGVATQANPVVWPGEPHLLTPPI